MAEPGPGGKEIGRVSVRVVPDSTGFRAMAQSQLEREMAGVDAEADLELGDTKKFRAQAKAATEGLEAKVKLTEDKQSIDRWQRRMSGLAENAMKKLESKISLTPDGERMRRQTERAFDALGKDIRADIPVDLHLAAGQRAKVFGEIQALQAMADANPIDIKLEVDENRSYKIHQFAAKARQKAIEDEAKAEKTWAEKLARYHQGLQDQRHRQRLADFKDELRAMKEREDEARKFADNYRNEQEAQRVARLAPDDNWRKQMRAELDKASRDLSRQIPFTADGESLLRDLRAKVKLIEDSIDAEIPVDLELAAAQRAKIKAEIESIRARVKVDLDIKKSRLGGLKQTLSEMPLPKFGSGLNPAAYALIFAGILDFAAPLIGILSAALMSLPGLISLVAAPIAAVTLGLEGFKKAAEKIKPEFNELRKVMSDVAESEFTPVLDRVAKTVFPMLERSLPSVTTGLRHLADGVVDALNNPDNKLEQTILNIGNALAAAKPGVDGFVSGFLQLANSLSERFPSIVQWFNDAGTAFNNWVAKASQDGTLKGAFDGLGQSLKIILDTLTELGGKGLEFMKDPQNLQMFKDQLQGIANLLKDIMDLSIKVNEKWDQIKDVGHRVKTMIPGIDWGIEGYDALFGGSEEAGSEAGAKTGEAFTDSMKKTLTGQGTGISGPGGLDGLLQNVAGGPTGQTPAVPPPNLEPAKSKISEYQSFVDQITAQVRGSLQQATSGESLPAPNFEAFKAAWSELPVFVTTQLSQIQTAATGMGTLIGGALSTVTAAAAPAWEGLKVQAISAFNLINQAASQLPGQIGASLGQLNGIGTAAGQSLIAGLRSGIEGAMPGLLSYVDTIAGQIAAHKGPLPYDRTVLKPNGEALMEGLEAGLTTGFEPVLEKAKSMAEQISEAMADGTNLASLLGGSKFPELTKMLDELETQRKSMKVELDNTTDKGAKQALRDKMAQLQTQKDALSLQKQELTNAQKYGGELADQVITADEWANKFVDVGVNFARATGDQAMSDLGIGGGAITGLGNALLDYGVQMAKKGVTNIYTTSMDDALAAKQRQDNRAAMQWRK